VFDTLDTVIGLNRNEWNIYLVLYVVVVCIGLNLTIYFILGLIDTRRQTADPRFELVQV